MHLPRIAETEVIYFLNTIKPDFQKTFEFFWEISIFTIQHSRRSCRIDSKASDNSVIYLYRHHLYISFRWYYCQKFVSDCFKTEIELFQAGRSKTFDFSKQSNLKPIRRPKSVFVFLFRNYLTAEKCWHFSGRIIINNLIIWIFMHVCVCVGVCVYFQGPYSLIYGKW